MNSKRKLIIEAFRQKGFIRKLPDIYRMFKAMIQKKYKPNYRGFILPAIALVYLISPIDFVPDFIPVIGLMDDVAIIAFIIPFLLKEVEKYLIWKGEKEAKPIRTIDIDAN